MPTPSAYSVQSTWPICVRRAAEGFDLGNHFAQPWRNRLGFLQALQAVIVAEAERGDAALALERAELERF